MISKGLLDDIEAFEVDTEIARWKAWDIYTLHFRQWWKKNKVIRFSREIWDEDYVANTFTHGQSPSSMDFVRVLEGHIISTYGVELPDEPEPEPEPKPEVIRKGNVFQIQFKEKETEKEKEES